jgi:hypothetical protein
MKTKCHINNSFFFSFFRGGGGISVGAASRMTANARLTTFPPNGILFLLNCAFLSFIRRELHRISMEGRRRPRAAHLIITLFDKTKMFTA